MSGVEIPSRERFRGCLVGQALGDALGFVVEGQPPEVCSRYVERIAGGRPPRRGRGNFSFGQYSDDTQLARELLRSYAERGAFEPEDYARRIALMFVEERVVGGGRSTREAAERLSSGVPWDGAGTPPPAAGNGSAMRAGAVGLLFGDDPEALVRVARDQGYMTHRDPRCSAGAVAVAGAVALAATGSVERLDFLGRLEKLARLVDKGFAEHLLELSNTVSLSPEEAARRIAPTGLGRRAAEVANEWVEISPFVTPSVLWSLYSFLKSPDDYWLTIRTAIAVGGDVDTTAAMAGAISGAHLGLAAVPEILARGLTDRGSWGLDELCGLADECHRLRSGSG